MTHYVWTNSKTGHHFASGPDGLSLSGTPVEAAPDWAQDRHPDMVFGPLVAWHGGECPVDPNSEVRCIFRGRRPYIGPALYPHLSDDAKAAMWKHAPHKSRIDPKMDIVSFQERLA